MSSLNSADCASGTESFERRKRCTNNSADDEHSLLLAFVEIESQHLPSVYPYSFTHLTVLSQG